MMTACENAWVRFSASELRLLDAGFRCQDSCFRALMQVLKMVCMNSTSADSSESASTVGCALFNSAGGVRP